AAGEDLRSTLLTLIGDVTSNYAQARGYQARIALARRTAASQRETAALTRTKFEAGSSSALDVANAAGLANSTEANIPSLETSYAEAVHRLSV
ncbi:TolC family protein, partial [Escherichia coli]|nr:TolC family protein [Escherichia coli]